jgi:hypothetical protein
LPFYDVSQIFISILLARGSNNCLALRRRLEFFLFSQFIARIAGPLPAPPDVVLLGRGGAAVGIAMDLFGPVLGAVVVVAEGEASGLERQVEKPIIVII